MIKNNKLNLILSSLATLVPCIFGIIFWDRLPDNSASKWAPSNKTAVISEKVFFIFLFPLILLALQWLLVFLSVKLDKNKTLYKNKKIFSLVLWIIPFISFFTSFIMYATILDFKISISFIMMLLFGVLFAVLGNYMPKTEQNYVFGLRIGSTFKSKENWNATHRLAGKMWFIGGILLILLCWLPAKIAFIVLFATLMVITIVPIVYSLRYNKLHTLSEEEKNEYKNNPPFGKKSVVVCTISVCLILAFVGVIMFTGSITFEPSENNLTVTATYYSDAQIQYDQIDSVELVEDFKFGAKINGFNSMKMLLGTFKNDTLGQYTLYSYTGTNTVIVIKSGDKAIVLGQRDPNATKDLYKTITNNIK